MYQSFIEWSRTTRPKAAVTNSAEEVGAVKGKLCSLEGSSQQKEMSLRRERDKALERLEKVREELSAAQGELRVTKEKLERSEANLDATIEVSQEPKLASTHAV